MKTHRALNISFLLLLAALGSACQPATESPTDSQTPQEAQSPEANTPAASDTGDTESGDEVTYEPAYPADVSTESLDADDTAQQKTHDHGEGEHSHGEGSHSHDGSDPEHDGEHGNGAEDGDGDGHEH